MRLPAIGKNIKLLDFCDAVQHFFTEQKYQSSTHQTTKGYYVIGRPVSSKDLRPNVVVIVKGEPNDFTIEMQPAKPQEIGARTRVGAFFFGTFAGLEIKRATEEQERYIEFEKLFWKYVKNIVKKLTQVEH
ncbi:MAG: hypothetical protein ACFE89_03025 [Candidatus Hodarchaeota archaeon]